MSRPDPLVVRPLTPGDDRSRFRSGNIELDRFFQRYAGQNQLWHQLGTTWVAEEGGTICGTAKLNCVGIVVDAKAEAAAFCRALGFQPLACSKGALGDRPAPLPMFLPLRSLPG